MKKLMIAAAIVCAAAISQAAAINWASSSVAYSVDVSLVGDNGSYSAATSGTNNRMSKGAYTYVLTLYAVGTSTVIGSASGDVKFYSNKFQVANIAIDAAEKGVKYDYSIVISGTQPALTSKESDTYDYSSATLTSTLTGQNLLIATAGSTSLLSSVPTTWTVSGIETKEEPEPTPEPTSGLLMLLGMAGLALRRKQK